MVLIRGDVFHMLFRKYAVLNPVQQSTYMNLFMNPLTWKLLRIVYVVFCVCFHIDGIIQKC